MSTDEARAFWIAAPGRGEIRRERLPRAVAGRGRRPRAVQRHQPRHRGARVRGRVPPSEYQRMRAPFQDGEFPGAGEIRLCERRRRRDGGADSRGRRVFVPLSAPDALCRAGRRGARAAATTCRRRARCWPRTSRRRSTACGTRGRRSAIASRSSAPARSAVWSAWLAGADPRLRGRARRHQSGARGNRARRSASASPLPDAARRDADVVIHASGSPAGLDARARRRRHSKRRSSR